MHTIRRGVLAGAAAWASRSGSARETPAARRNVRRERRAVIRVLRTKTMQAAKCKLRDANWESGFGAVGGCRVGFRSHDGFRNDIPQLDTLAGAIGKLGLRK